MQKQRLVVSEQFYSLQGEGPSVGRPALFLRLAGCNLNCTGFSYVDPSNGEHLGCDTKLVWQKGKAYSIDALLNEWQRDSWLEKLTAGVHLVITGGEPLLQQSQLEYFLRSLDLSLQSSLSYLEMETNATLLPNAYLSERINQFNVSPKLSSSLEPKAKAYQEKILQHFVDRPQAIFKFVIQSEKDVIEVIEHYQKPFNIPPQRIWLMPEGGTLATLQPKMPMVAELCKQYHFNFSPRLHIHLWDQATGV
jgi:7-carboxy-7-deazaguanine synthase